MSEAKKLPSGRWRNQLFVGFDERGKRQYESFTADTRAEANLLAAKRKQELEDGIRKKTHPTTMTVGEAIDQYIEDRSAILAPKTIREYKGYRRRYMQGIMRIKLSALTTETVQREINQAARLYSPKTVQSAWGLCYTAIHAAVPEMIFSVKLPKKIKREMNIPTNAELLALFAAVEGKPLEIPVLLAATCGLRRGEIAALDFKKDMDYQKNTLTVNKSISNDEHGNWVVKPPKTYESNRTVDVPEWVAEKLRAARDSGYRPIHPEHITSQFTRLRNKLGLSIRFHDLRHYYASLLLSLGVPDKYAMRRMGHATPNMLKNVYQHLMEEKDSEITHQVNAYFDSMQHGMQHASADECEQQRKTKKKSD